MAAGTAQAPSREQVVELFREFDTNGDGTIDVYEFKKVMMKLGDDPLTECEACALFEGADMNGNGRINLREFINWLYSDDEKAQPESASQKIMIHFGHADTNLPESDEEEEVAEPEQTEPVPAPIPENADKKLVAMFQRWDANMDGLIGKDELKELLLRLGFPSAHADDIIALADKNKDGRITYEEFVKIVFTPPDDTPSDALGVFTEDADDLKVVQKALWMISMMGQDTRLSDAELSEIAAVPGQDARHPQRAHAGRLLIRHATTASSDDARGIEEDIITRLFFDSIPKEHVEIKSIEKVVKTEFLGRFLERMAQENSSVEVSFHGTGPENIEAILSMGISTGMSKGAGRALYGDGAYVGTHAGIAHKYATPDKQKVQRMFCVLVDVGTDAVEGCKATRHEASAMDSLRNPTQYILVHEDRMLISHVITYSMKSSRALKMKRPEDLKMTLKAAIDRADERVQSRGIR